METLTTERPTDWREWRRLRAWDLYEQRWKQKDIATALGVTAGAVSQWITRGRDGGREALQTQSRSGGQPRLTSQQRDQIPALLRRGATTFGFLGDIWITKRIGLVIKQTFGVIYHPAHISRLMRALGWSVQQPQQQATQRDEAAIQQWWDQRWPVIKKTVGAIVPCMAQFASTGSGANARAMLPIVARLAFARDYCPDGKKPSGQ
jgi:transposase